MSVTADSNRTAPSGFEFHDATTVVLRRVARQLWELKVDGTTVAIRSDAVDVHAWIVGTETMTENPPSEDAA